MRRQINREKETKQTKKLAKKLKFTYLLNPYPTVYKENLEGQIQIK